MSRTISTPPPAVPLPTVVYSNGHLAPPDRFAHWRDLLSRTHAPMDLRSEHSDDFPARQRVIALGDVTVWPAAFPPVTFHRTRKLIRQSDPESYHLTLMLRGEGVADWCDRTLRAGPGTFHTSDSSRPVEIRSGAAGGRILMIGVEVPKAVLPLPRRLADRSVGIPIPDSQGVGGLLSHFLRQLVHDLPEYRLADGPRLGSVVADLVAAVLAQGTENVAALPEQVHGATNVLRIRAFIQQHLGDPALSPSAVAGAHHISTGYLHRIFRNEGITVGALIRRQRLEHARAELVDPRWAGHSIRTIAARWCLTAPEFSRSFRAAYGMTPGEYRRLGPSAGSGD
ncbi:helix-turn-helix domain-containing protein [Streptomyces qinzhouensis]|uniref:Helix-turn-helix domain-containing protein n=1 Tax=Streptomyces qinzhouensis TaxID=2599401 RepID=A0A5B8JE66_9ACTN|nr:helix-turn-helix domain-containing protein [Streptomyces qinzhouensis]QDY79696.1 helix-turn-helix domain-containing protein [Streptomyces qinzhouensis]